MDEKESKVLFRFSCLSENGNGAGVELLMTPWEIKQKFSQTVCEMVTSLPPSLFSHWLGSYSVL